MFKQNIQLNYSFRTFQFELWADRGRIMGGQDFISTLASYFELCFVFQLKYPSQCQAVCQIIQLRMLRYGDPESGTLTTMRKKQAQNKLQGYLLALGKISVEK